MGVESGWFRLTGIAAVMVLVKQTGDQIMTALEDIQVQIGQINTATNDIADDIKGLKEQLDQAITSGDVEAQLEEKLRTVSDALAPLVTRLEDVASQTDTTQPTTDEGAHVDNTLPEPETPTR
jgi:hypothetical protein